MIKKNIGKESLRIHRKLRGKIQTSLKGQIKNASDLAIYYTPGVGAVSSFLATHKKETNTYTGRGNTVAVISDGSAVLGLGNIGPEAALPVMEGKARTSLHSSLSWFGNISLLSEQPIFKIILLCPLCLTFRLRRCW
jgi:malic enzyme